MADKKGKNQASNAKSGKLTGKKKKKGNVSKAKKAPSNGGSKEVHSGGNKVSAGDRRDQNYSKKELDVLVNMCIEKMDLLESNLSAEITREMKDDAWKSIAGVNGIGGNDRPWEKVRKKWSDLKSKAVTTYNRYQRACNQTGGGKAPDPPKYSKWEQLIIDMLLERKSNLLSGLSNGFDTGFGDTTSVVPSETAPQNAETGETSAGSRTITKKRADAGSSTLRTAMKKKAEGPPTSPVGDLRVLLESIRSQQDGMQSPASQNDSEALFDDDFQDATENTPRPSQESSVHPIDMSVDGTSQNESVPNTQENSQPVEGERVSDETWLQRFRLKSVRDRKRQLDTVHLEYFTNAAAVCKQKKEMLKEQTAVLKLKRQKLTNEVAAQEEMSQLNKRKAQLEIAHYEAVLKQQGIDVTPPAAGASTSQTKEDTGTTESTIQETEPAEEEVTSPGTGDTTYVPTVRLSIFAMQHSKVIQYLFDREYESYEEMPLFDDMHDYIPDVKSHKGAFKTFLASLGMNYDYENTSIRVYIIQNFGHKLSDNRDERENVLQGIADYMCNVYLNKRSIPTKFWHKRYQAP